MIPNRIKNILQFIDYLHSNIEYFNRYKEYFIKNTDLSNEIKSLNTKNIYEKKIKSIELKKQRKQIRNLIDKDVYTPIFKKVYELNFYDFERQETSLWNDNIKEILELKDNFNEVDIPEINTHKEKYIEFLSKIEIELIPTFFKDLNEILEELFEFSKDNEQTQIEITPISEKPPTPAPEEDDTNDFKAPKIKDKYCPDKIFKEFKKDLKCTKNTFENWFINGKHDKKMNWLYKDGNKDQLRSFLFEVCGGWTPSETNTAFNLIVNSNNRATNLNNEMEARIKKCLK